MTEEEYKDIIRDLKDRVHDLKDRAAEARDESDAYREELVSALDTIENYHAFLLEPAEEDGFVQSRLGTIIDEYNSLAGEYNKLLRKHQRLVSDWNRRLTPPVPGRPIEASDDQQDEVRKLRKKGRSLRGIALDSGLSLKTVRTIVSHMTGKTKKAQADRLKRERMLAKYRQADTRVRKRAKDSVVAETKSLLKTRERLKDARR